MTTPHDVEEAMRPYLGKVLDAEEATNAVGEVRAEGSALELLRASAHEIRELNIALAKALELLGISR